MGRNRARVKPVLHDEILVAMALRDKLQVDCSV